jgi:hypothetical protein
MLFHQNEASSEKGAMTVYANPINPMIGWRASSTDDTGTKARSFMIETP